MGFLYRTLVASGRPLLRLFYRHKVVGKASLPGEGAIIASSHTSFLDPVVVGFSWPEEVFFLARSTLFRPAFFGAFLRKLHAYPLHQGRDAASTFRVAGDLLAQGKKVVIFPEGHRQPTPEIGAVKRGVAVLASQSKCAVIPVYVDGVYEVWNRKQWFPRPWGRITTIIGEPIPWSRFEHLPKDEAQRALSEELRAALIALKTTHCTGSN